MDIGKALEIVYSQKLSEERIQQIILDLEEPFPVEEVLFKPQATFGDTAQAAAYADPRSYSDRLNRVVGYGGWFELCTLSFSERFQHKIKGDWVVDPNDANGKKKIQLPSEIADICKCCATVSIGIIGLGFHTEVGESEADDANAATIAYAQALKRAAMHFGLGRYFYEFPKLEVLYDKFKKKFTTTPQIPDFAWPKCRDCKQYVLDQNIHGQLWTQKMILNVSWQLYRAPLCGPCIGVRKAAHVQPQQLVA